VNHLQKRRDIELKETVGDDKKVKKEKKVLPLLVYHGELHKGLKIVY